MWNEKRELLKHAASIARQKHPDGFNKDQLIDCSKEVFGGYSANPEKPIKTMRDVSDMGNHMSEIDGRYPRGMSGCSVVGMNGGCGFECPVFLNGECGEPQEFDADELIAELGTNAESVISSYSCFNHRFEESGKRWHER